MAYNESDRAATYKYRNNKYQRLYVGFTKDLWEHHLLPTITDSGLPLSTFMRIAIIEKVLREGKTLNEDERNLLREFAERISSEKSSGQQGSPENCE